MLRPLLRFYGPREGKGEVTERKKIKELRDLGVCRVITRDTEVPKDSGKGKCRQTMTQKPKP